MATLTGGAATAVTHASSGAPTCTGVTAPFALTSLQAPTGSLTGTITLINVTSGADMGYTADALHRFINVTNYYDPSSPLPSLTQAAPPRSLVLGADRSIQDTLPAASPPPTPPSRPPPPGPIPPPSP